MTNLALAKAVMEAKESGILPPGLNDEKLIEVAIDDLTVFLSAVFGVRLPSSPEHRAFKNKIEIFADRFQKAKRAAEERFGESPEFWREWLNDLAGKFSLLTHYENWEKEKAAPKEEAKEEAKEEEPPKRKRRGRPPKSEKANETAAPKRKRGRPPKKKDLPQESEKPSEDPDETFLAIAERIAEKKREANARRAVVERKLHLIRKAKEMGLSNKDIANALFEAYGVKVSVDMVRRALKKEEA